MISFETLWLFALASTAIIVVPGPTVTVIIANSLRYGSNAGLLNVVGTQLGLSVMLIALIIGFSALVSAMAWMFDILRIVGAAYLAWLGIQLWRSRGSALRTDEVANNTQQSPFSLIGQGFLVIWSNPKALFFFGAFLPQFVDHTRPIPIQLVQLGMVFMVVATFFDGLYAIAAGRAGQWLSQQRLRLVECLSGSLLIAGSIWLLTREQK